MAQKDHKSIFTSLEATTSQSTKTPKLQNNPQTATNEAIQKNGKSGVVEKKNEHTRKMSSTKCRSQSVKGKKDQSESSLKKEKCSTTSQKDNDCLNMGSAKRKETD